eukprot:5367519-Prorocentrum_lima.AAC.1
MTYGMKLIVTSNTWTRQVAECKQEDREWLAGNSVHVLEDASCWQLLKEGAVSWMGETHVWRWSVG